MNILVFGDQTANQDLLLRKAFLSLHNTLLQEFLLSVTRVVQEEVQKLPFYQRESIPSFSKIEDLVNVYYEEEIKDPVLETCFITIAQLVHYIGYYTDNPSEFPSSSNVQTIGICTGAFAASVVASARSLAELLPLAVEAVRLAFRTGCCVKNIKDTLDQPGRAQENWSTIIADTPEENLQKALDDFHHQSGIEVYSQVYISAVGSKAITISGPPSNVRRFLEVWQSPDRCRIIPIPVYAPYHAHHLFPDYEVEKIVEDTSGAILKDAIPIFHTLSAVDGNRHSCNNTLDLVKTVLHEMLQEPVRWDKVLSQIVTEFRTSGFKSCSLTMFGEGNVANSLVSALSAAGAESINVKDHSFWVPQRQKPTKPQDDKIAIVGMSGRFPGAASHEKLWEILEKGLDVHREVPIERFDPTVHCDATGKGKNMSHTPYGCFIDEPGLFDPRFFNMSPREAAQTDPMARLALVTAYEALEMAGYVPNRTPSSRLDRIGTFYGQTSDDWREINAAENIDTYFITGGVRAFGPGRINYHFKFSGPSFSIDTACSSSLAAIQLACTSLWAGDCDTACAGGVNVLTNPDIFAGLSKGQFLSKTGSCKTYDNNADGYCRGDSCGTVILKRYQDAIADKDNILGCILSAATNHSAEAVSITHPHAGTQEALYTKILSRAGVDPHEISYVEMHGTGTQAGDSVEMTSVTNVFAPRNRQRRPEQTLHLGAIKANIGHGEAASGIASLIKILLMFQKDAIPSNVGIKGVMNKSFPTDLVRRNVHIETKKVEFPRKFSGGRKVVLNNFSAAGGNTALVLEDGPEPALQPFLDPRTAHVITVSAKSIASLKRNIKNLIDWVEQNPHTTMADLSYTTTARRIQHRYRIAFPVSNDCSIGDKLSSQLKEAYNPIPVEPAKVIFVFTGQGSQYASLGRQLYQTLPSFKIDMDRFDSLARSHGFDSFLPLIKGDHVDDLSSVIIQLGMSCIQVALTRMWISWNVKPHAVIGHSLGEYAALCASGVLSVSDMILLVGRRAQLLEKYCQPNSYGMLAVQASEKSIIGFLGSDTPTIACLNGPDDTVLSGSNDVIQSTKAALTNAGLKNTLVNVQYAFHSSQMDPLLPEFEQLATAATFNRPEIPVISTLLGETIHSDGIFGPKYLSRHARETVNFSGALQSAEGSNIFDEKTAWLEIGAHPVCSGMIKKSLHTRTFIVPSLRRGEDNWKTLTASVCEMYVAGIPINFNEYHREFDQSHRLLVLPTYSFDNKTYWLEYHNNWTLTKGEKLTSNTEGASSMIPDLESKLSTTSCHRIIQEELYADSGRVIIRSNLNDPKLKSVIDGHQVNDNPLCPSSLYADQAMTIADYLYRQVRPKLPVPGLNICAMEVFKPLVPRTASLTSECYLQIDAVADLNKSDVTIHFRSLGIEGPGVLSHHASTTVKYEETDTWREDWARVQYMVQTQIDILEKKAANQAAHRIQRGMAYKLFKSLVNYADRYRGMEEVILDGKDTEAVAQINFQTTYSDGNFFCSPYWIDSLAHISGFTVNASEHFDSQDSVYISHGWSSIRIAEKLSAGKKYRSYVRMQPSPHNISVGDVYILEEERIIGVVKGLKFQKIPRRALDVMLPPNNVSRGVTGNTQHGERSKAPDDTRKQLRTSPEQYTNQENISIESQFLKIIAEETDVDISELVDGAAFENLGVDSLMSLTISAKFREDLNLEIPPTLFTDYPTIGEMRNFFSRFNATAAIILEDSSYSSSENLSHLSSPMEDGTDRTTSPVSTSTRSSSVSKNHADAAIVRDIIAEEMGVDVSEITDDFDLSQAGMDSLMSLTILGAIREKIAIEVSSDLLTANVTMKEIIKRLSMCIEQEAKSAIASTEKLPELAEVNRKLQIATIIDNSPSATSVLLQGSLKTAVQTLFLLPDGSGSATSYISIPPISPSLAVYGLNCPFMKTPENWTCGVEGVSALYAKEIQRRQKRGPYLLGGWSAGGVLAYEVCHQLLKQGEKVEALLLIDAPCPISLDPLPARLHVFFDQIGLLGTGKPGGTPKWLLPHFAAAIQNLKDYKPVPINTKQAPAVVAIWCTDGVCPNPEDPRPPPGEGEDPKPMKWLLNNRDVFDDNGWAQLLPSDNFKYAVMGGNHFTMMKGEHASTLGKLIQESLNL